MCNKSDFIKLHTLGVIAHGKKRDKNKEYTLPPIEKWTKEFCDSLNNIEYNKSIVFSLDNNNDLIELHNEEIKKTFEIFSHISEVERISIYDKLPVDFVRFTDTVILKQENVEYADACAASIDKSLPFYKRANIELDKILNSKSKPLKKFDKELFDNISLSCAIDTKSKNNDRANPADNNIFNELLQNANDRITDGIMRITITDDEMILSYNEVGFSAKDFIAICTKGNSGSREDASKTGKKGTGFKSVYQVFKKVVIESKIENGSIVCTLDDERGVEIKYDKEEPYLERPESKGKKNHYPVPLFTENKECKSDNTTTIALTFINEDKRDKFVNKNFLDSIEKFKVGYSYLFLDNIKTFKMNDKIFNKEEYLKQHFIRYEDTFEIEENKPKEPPEGGITNKVVVLLPKEKCLPKETKMYCTLPVSNESLKVPFYLNCQAFELEDGRNSIATNDDYNERNDLICEKAIEVSESAFSNIFKEFAKENTDIAYKYFPYYYIGEIDKNDKWDC